MNKKVLVILIAMIIGLVGYSTYLSIKVQQQKVVINQTVNTNKENSIKTDQIKQKSNVVKIEKDQKSSIPDQTKTEIKESPKNRLKKYLVDGRADSMDVELGTNIEEVIKKFGSPKNIRYEDSLAIYEYDDYGFLTWANSKEINEIIFFGNSEVFGIKKGMEKRKVIELLGTPTEEYSIDDDKYGEYRILDTHTGDNYISYYEFNEDTIYILNIYFDKDTKLAKKVVITAHAND